MKILAEISTHKVVREHGEIKLYIKTIKDLDTMQITLEHVYNLPHEDDVLPHMELLEENNRILRNDFINEIS